MMKHCILKGYTCHRCDPSEHFTTRGELRRHQVDLHTMPNRPSEVTSSLQATNRNHRSRRGQDGKS